jgi:uncharacterized protein (DUF1778 family)
MAVAEAVRIRRRAPKPKKDARHELRMTRALKSEMEAIAAERGQTLSDFMLSAAQAELERYRKEQLIMRLAEADREAFFNALENPPQSGQRLARIFQRRRQFIA